MTKTIIFALFAAAACAAPITVDNFGPFLSDPVTASATYWTADSAGAVAVTAFDFPGGSLTLNVPDLPFDATDTSFILSLTLVSLAGDSGFGFTAASMSSVPSYFFPVECSAGIGCGPVLWSVPYAGPGEIDISWEPFFPINFDYPGPPTAGPFFASATLEISAEMSVVGTLLTPEPSTFAPLALVLGLGRIALRRRKAST